MTNGRITKAVLHIFGAVNPTTVAVIDDAVVVAVGKEKVELTTAQADRMRDAIAFCLREAEAPVSLAKIENYAREVLADDSAEVSF